MCNLKFYEIDIDYVKYLKIFDRQVPDLEYQSNNKFSCGIVYTINEFDYFAPVSSFKVKQKTNFVIKDNNEAISSIRFCFMFPVPKDKYKLCDFNSKKQTYKDLVNAEYEYCKSNVTEIQTLAEKVYKIGSNRNHPLAYTCCDFKLLERTMQDYIQLQEIKKLDEVAVTVEREDN
ncbi:type III toxin-antitoxin system ToxN/AbiQ family toxin [Clostridium sp.]|uniref:type III toxin-antitoxin system ToxN/AbiQ family toxin n=1 Tax=Clostridium sp. TaxID=1506 RepID=UPI001A446EE5|nr:type III toxin-antitoxin system ToxN/AbiQ family toxin [Clostridium sp.]MBK5239827.1 type III toxin-antitoxin system ToxN/AbiQ family toxin [Clostridium sp.]